MGRIVKYSCSAECQHVQDMYDGKIHLDFAAWALHHPEHIAEHGRHSPEEITCPFCGAVAYKVNGVKERAERHARAQLYAEECAKKRAEFQAHETAVIAKAERVIAKAEAYLAARDAELDPARIYLLARGQTLDVTARFRSAV